jgi:hypothetical protein
LVRVKESGVSARFSAGTARHLQLARTARLAGEAFAFNDSDARLMPAARRPTFGAWAWGLVTLAAGVGLYLGF